MTTNEDAIAHIGFQLSQKLLGVIVDNGILHPNDAAAMLNEMAAMNEGARGPANKAAAHILRQMAATYAVPDDKH